MHELAAIQLGRTSTQELGAHGKHLRVELGAAPRLRHRALEVRSKDPLQRRRILGSDGLLQPRKSVILEQIDVVLNIPDVGPPFRADQLALIVLATGAALADLPLALVLLAGYQGKHDHYGGGGPGFEMSMAPQQSLLSQA